MTLDRYTQTHLGIRTRPCDCVAAGSTIVAPSLKRADLPEVDLVALPVKVRRRGRVAGAAATGGRSVAAALGRRAA